MEPRKSAQSMVGTKRVGRKVKMSLFLILSGFQKKKERR